MALTERYVTVAGAGAHDGTSESDAWTLAEAIAAPVAAGQRINVKAGTYANTTTSRTLSTAGTAGSPIIWRGYNTSIGDIDSDNSLTKPAWTWTTGLLTVSGAYNTLQNIDISGARTSSEQVLLSGNNTRIIRCRVENTNAGSASSAIRFAPAPSETGTAIACWFQATTTATACVTIRRNAVMDGCYIGGGDDGINTDSIATAARYLILRCIFDNQAAHCIYFPASSSTAANVLIDGCSFYSPGTDAIRFDLVSQLEFAHISNNIFSEIGGTAINNNSGGSGGEFTVANNLYHSITTAEYSGETDDPQFYKQTDSGSPFVMASTDNFGVADGSNAKANGVPGGFENESSTTSYLDIGAVQREEPAGGASSVLGGGALSGGFAG